MKVGVIGCGFFAQNHLHAWRDIEGVDVVALCDNDQSNLFATSKKFKIGGNLLMPSSCLSMVSLTSWILLQQLLLIGLLLKWRRRTKHIICQKPFAESVKDARAMVGQSKLLENSHGAQFPLAVRRAGSDRGATKGYNW